MKRVAVIFESSPFDRKGLFNSVHNRVKGLVSSGKCQVDVYCIQSSDNFFTGKIRHRKPVPRVEVVDVEGIQYNMLWYRFSLIDYLLFDCMSCRPLMFRSFMKHVVERLGGYDVISAHSFVGGLMAKEVYMSKGTPYFVTWHGSDVHTHPFRNSLQMLQTKIIMKNARCNFFVSKALLEASGRVVDDASIAREVIYNGVSDDFVRYSDQERAELKAVKGVGEGAKVVAFAGNLCHVKNVRVLASVFKSVRMAYQADVQFWIIGDGKLRAAVEADVAEASLDGVRFWGNMPSSEMPAMMNCIDVLVLPSLNEGLPLVCLEAIKCGANAVGSAAGGIAEAVGEGNVVSLGEGFVEALSQKILQMLEHPENQSVPAEMSWERASETELGHILSSN